MAMTTEVFDDLKVKGYAVVKDVLSAAECDDLIGQYKEWLSQFKDGDWPCTHFSLIQRYNTGNMKPTWTARLKSKKVFAQIWKTDKLLTSIDAVAIGRPPEDGAEPFHTPDSHWLHLDQYPPRSGLHAYQGAVYLEAADEDDWTLEVMKGSHKHHTEYFKRETACKGGQKLSDEDMLQYLKWGCIRERVAVPKGGLVLWDSRTVHANARPFKGRKHPGRWRWCVFVSMTPAIWATEEDIQLKKVVYEHAYMTSHWSSQDISYFESGLPEGSSGISYQSELPDVAKTDECKKLCGVVAYDFEDGKPTGKEFTPRWQKSRDSKEEANVNNGNRWSLSDKTVWIPIAAVSVLCAIVVAKARN